LAKFVNLTNSLRRTIIALGQTYFAVQTRRQAIR
jgi:hypothetical protein